MAVHKTKLELEPKRPNGCPLLTTLSPHTHQVALPFDMARGCIKYMALHAQHSWL